MPTEYRVLITAAGSKGVPGLINDLRQGGNKFYIVAVDINPEAIGNLFADKRYIVPPWDDKGYIRSIKEIIRKEKIQYVIPNDNHIGLLKMCDLSMTEKNLKIAISNNKKHLAIAFNKLKLFDFLRSHGMSNYIPRYKCVKDKHSLLRGIKEFGYPKAKVVIKPILSEGSRGLKIITELQRNFFEERGNSRLFSFEELKFYLKDKVKLPRILIMEYLPGDEYSVDVLVNKNRKIEYMVPRMREQISEGTSVRGTIHKNREIERLSACLLKKLDLIYALNIQIKYSKSRAPKIIEVNPRVSGAMAFCSSAGVNLHYYLILLLANKTLPKAKIKYGTTVYRYYTEKHLLR